MIKRFFCLVLCILTVCTPLVSCKNDGKGQMLSFAQAQSISEMKKLDGKTVTIIGYMSTLSPVSGEFMYLMNLPYQSCPFCIPNTTQLSNTIAVYAKSKEGFEFTDRAIKVTGVLEFGSYTDQFEYEYNYRIVDATYKILDTSELSDEIKLYQQLASTDVIAEIYNMFDYINFLCWWPTYTATFDGGEDYVYPDDAIRFIEDENGQFSYGFKEGYFDDIIATVKSVDPNAFADLITIIENAKLLANDGYNALKNGAYTKTVEYSSTFNDGRPQYKITDEQLQERMQSTYNDFSNWLASWEL